MSGTRTSSRARSWMAVPEEWIREEEQRIGPDLRFNAIADEAERARQLRIAAQHSAIDRMLVAQTAAHRSPGGRARSAAAEAGRQWPHRVRRWLAAAVGRAAVPPATYACGDGDGSGSAGGAGSRSFL